MPNKPAITTPVSVGEDFKNRAKDGVDRILAEFDGRMKVLLGGVDANSDAAVEAAKAAIDGAVPRNSVVMPSHYATHHLARRRR